MVRALRNGSPAVSRTGTGAFSIQRIVKNLPGLASAAFGPLWAAIVIVALVVVSAFAVRFYLRARVDRSRRLEADRVSHWTNQLQTLTRELSRAMSVAEVVEASLTEFLHTLGATTGLVALVAGDGKQATVARAIGFDPSVDSGIPLSLGSETLLGRAIADRDLRVFGDSDRADGILLQDSTPLVAGGGTTVIAPLIADNRSVAVLCIIFFDSNRALTNDEREFLVTGGRRTAEALVRADQYESAQRARAEAEHLRRRGDEELRERRKVEGALRESETRYRALAARTNHLYALSASLSEALTLDGVAKAIVSRSRFVAGASAASVALLNEDQTGLETLHAEEYPPHVVDAWRSFAPGPGLCWTEALTKRQPVFVSSFGEWQARFPASAVLGADCGFASLAGVPLLVDDAPVGVLMFHFVAPVSFDPEYRAVLVAVAHHSAQAVDRARLYESAQQARIDAEAANRSKDDFLSIISHELRTPLTAVLGWASMLRKGSLEPARMARAIDAICSNATRQAQLIDELLDVSRLVGGRAVFELREIDLRDTLRGVVEAIMPLSDAKGIEVCLGAHPTVPVTADPRRLEQVFLNLLTNAVKFTPPGGRVSIDATICGADVQIRVTDNGSGIDPDFLPFVFERFRQGADRDARAEGGVGLGLFIARQLVEGQGGTIRAESPGSGQGSTFIVTLPVTKSARAVQVGVKLQV
jgi:signal transduction histidine kinase